MTYMGIACVEEGYDRLIDDPPYEVISCRQNIKKMIHQLRNLFFFIFVFFFFGWVWSSGEEMVAA